MEIQLSRGLVAIADEDDAEKINAFKWCAVGHGRYLYAYARINKKTVAMHRLVVDAPPGMHVDHINGDRLDNRKDNLRVCTCAENIRNQGIRKGKRFKGIWWDRLKNRWKAGINVAGKRIKLGTFITEEQAALAYDAAASKLHGNFGVLNFQNAASPAEQ